MIWSTGVSYDLIVRSLLSQLVEAHHRGIMFTTVTMFEGLGAMIAGPVFAAYFQIGLHWGGIWIGLPFFASGLLFAICLSVLFSVRV